jgi:hypothetical protein
VLLLNSLCAEPASDPPITVVGLWHVVQVGRGVEREFLVGVHVDHGSPAQWSLKPDTYRTVEVVTVARSSLVIRLVADEYAHVDLVLPLVHDDLTDPVVVSAERDTELEFASVSLPKSERAANAHWASIGTRRRPLPTPLRVSLLIPHDDTIVRLVRPRLATPGQRRVRDSFDGTII